MLKGLPTESHLLGKRSEEGKRLFENSKFEGVVEECEKIQRV